jgi:hypothetical protein
MNRPIIVKVIFGSHLYGTDTPESDHDYKGIVLPTMQEMLLWRKFKSLKESTKGDRHAKNTSEDVETEMYSLHYFLELACKGETVALDMLHAPESAWIVSSDVWLRLVENRSRFYTRNLKALVGYARRQAAKYGVKGSRLATGEHFLRCLKKEYGDKPLKDLDWLETFVKNVEHAEWYVPWTADPLLQVCGKKFPLTCTVNYAGSIIQKFVDNYGHRAKLAKQNEGIDWKAISHALRAGYQVKHILEDGGFEYPLPETDVLVKVKKGEMDYTTEAAPLLDGLLEDVERLSRESELPDKVDRKWWDEWLLDVVHCTSELWSDESNRMFKRVGLKDAN